MLEEFIKDINELMEYKKKYEYAIKDKQCMSDTLYDLYLEKYNNQTFEERKQNYINDYCRSCRYNFDCNKNIIPKDITMPTKSDKGWFPPKTSCGNFEWS